LNCFEIREGGGLFVAKKNTQEKDKNEGGERRVEHQVIN
jgi:hypothetical protein